MAGEFEKNKTISKSNSGFPEYLDFNTLRKEGIEYLGQLSGKLWTDHNVHDPGITILEVLCYALTDLGYRTNLPVEDIFSRNPADNTPDNNFFTPAQILTCSPLTIIDYRKLLIDLKGVNNAWLEPAQDEKDICFERNPDPCLQEKGNYNRTENPCLSFLNGLYHVYLDLERDADRNETVAKVKKALMANRNICEDFIDIQVLCKLEVGVCADIELATNANPEKVYLELAEVLRIFFSPSPRFYTLQQLLEKGKSIEEIFAGRPYNLKESHGFVDTEELEQLELRKEIHLSDVYNVMLKVDGIKAVRALKLVQCEKPNFNQVDKWKFKLPKNYIPDFSVSCSFFRFTRNTMPVEVDFKKFEKVLEFNFQHNGKILYQHSSPYLDLSIPKGFYRSDLADYYSIQHEFPKVYGIGPGGLPNNVTPQRKVQALQLKGYLLFFDQLLANYLTQLQNIRNLFALYPEKGNKDQHTYFTNQLTTVPDYNELLRFGNTNTESEGNVLVFPYDKSELTKALENNTLKDINLDHLKSYNFNTSNERDIAIKQLRDDFLHERQESYFFSKNENCNLFYIYSSSEEFALVGKQYFSNINEARQAATSVKYIGTFDENYSTYSLPYNTFSIDFNLSSYQKYLQLLTEDKALYTERRLGFLNHLLTRFSETFTDYALLAAGFVPKDKLGAAEISVKEQFLKNYPSLSSSRGKGYNYLTDGWNNNNISGLESKFKALAGIKNLKKHNLCNIEVYKYEDTFDIEVEIEGYKLFKSDQSYTYEKAVAVLQSLFSGFQKEARTSIEKDDLNKTFKLITRHEKIRNFISPVVYHNHEDASIALTGLNEIFSGAKEEDVFISKYMYKLELRNYNQEVIRLSKKSYINENDAFASFDNLLPQINDLRKWEVSNSEYSNIGRLDYSKLPEKKNLIDFEAFKIDIDNNIEGKPDKFSYELLDKKNTFRFQSAKEFDNEKDAKEDSQLLISLLFSTDKYQVKQNPDNQKYYVHIVNNEKSEAISYSSSASEEKAGEKKDRILNLVRQYQFQVTVSELPHRWKFRYFLGMDKDHYNFESLTEYKSHEESLQASKEFSDHIEKLEVKEKSKKVEIVDPEDEKRFAVVLHTSDYKHDESTVKTIHHLLKLKSQVQKLARRPNPKSLRQFILPDAKSKAGNYVYRLVEKDSPVAWSPTLKRFRDEKSALEYMQQLINLMEKSFQVLELCLGGSDIIKKRKDEVTGEVWYHYQVQCRNLFYKTGENKDKAIVLFESVDGYTSEEEAERAFRKIYPLILKRASVRYNYGDNSFISKKEVYRGGIDSCKQKLPVVFIPKATWEYIPNGDKIAQFVKIVRSYPLRYIKKDIFKFGLFYPGDGNDKSEGEIWKSMQYFTTPQQAMEAFYFFYNLLKVPANYYVSLDKDNCSYKVYLREILAESRERFINAEDTWGKGGIQKFINITQSDNSFYTYQRDCCFTFYVACKNPFAIHPCKYNSPTKRDKVFEKLYSFFSQKNNIDYLKHFFLYEDGILRDIEGKVLFTVTDQKIISGCSSWLVFIELLANERSYIKSDEDLFYIIDERGEQVAQAAEGEVSFEDWKRKLQEFSWYFPIVKNSDKGDRGQYCIEIKIPEFNDWRSDLRELVPCANETPSDPQDPCFVAWKSDCCFSTCEEAIGYLKSISVLLTDYKSYRKVFDCTCGSYGIALQEENDIIGYNPQCYASEAIACAAVERARRAINSEGLHLVEHILLRPRCEEDLKDCRDRYCDNSFEHCTYTWRQKDEKDPCDQRPDICFTPGADPYSFIATAVLPAWPGRFRSKGHQQHIENILQREVPAHVLLRVLWLSPHDFCCFETIYKKWNRWIARKNKCEEAFSPSQLAGFLFDRPFECMDNGVFCQDCQNDQDLPVAPCLETRENTPTTPSFTEQINDLYCWEQLDCDRYEYLECGETIKREEPTPPDPVTPGQIDFFINKRVESYQAAVDKVVMESERNRIAVNIRSFLDERNPSFTVFKTLAADILRQEPNVEGMQLRAMQKHELAKNLMLYYLDIITFTSAQKPEDEKIIEVIGTMRAGKIHPETLYQSWKHKEVQRHTRCVDIQKIRNLFSLR